MDLEQETQKGKMQSTSTTGKQQRVRMTGPVMKIHPGSISLPQATWDTGGTGPELLRPACVLPARVQCHSDAVRGRVASGGSQGRSPHRSEAPHNTSGASCSPSLLCRIAGAASTAGTQKCPVLVQPQCALGYSHSHGQCAGHSDTQHRF